MLELFGGTERIALTRDEQCRHRDFGKMLNPQLLGLSRRMQWVAQQEESTDPESLGRGDGAGATSEASPSDHDLMGADGQPLGQSVDGIIDLGDGSIDARRPKGESFDGEIRQRFVDRHERCMFSVCARAGGQEERSGIAGKHHVAETTPPIGLARPLREQNFSSARQLGDPVGGDLLARTVVRMRVSKKPPVALLDLARLDISLNVELEYLHRPQQRAGCR